MKKLNIYLLLIIIVFPFSGCQRSNKSTPKIDNKSYITNFVLLQDNPSNQTSIKITSPKAIINPTNNDIEIFESSIELLNKNGQDFNIISGNSTLNNLSNVIKVFNNVKISFLDNEDYSITTNSFNWNLNNSVIDINNPLNINFDKSRIIATNGFYNIDLSLLKIDNTEFYRNIYNSEGDEKYKIEITSDFAKWFKTKNTLVFSSIDKQVETTINFLITK